MSALKPKPHLHDDTMRADLLADTVQMYAHITPQGIIYTPVSGYRVFITRRRSAPEDAGPTDPGRADVS